MGVMYLKKKGIKINLIYNIIYQLLLIFLPLISTPYISRILGPEKIGIYSYTYSIAYNFMLIIMLGVSNYGNRTIASVKEDEEKLCKTFWSIYYFQLIRAVVLIIIYLISVTIFFDKYKFIFYLQSIYLFSGLLDISWFFFGMEEFKITVLKNIVIKILSIISMFCFVKTENDLWIYTLIMTTSTLLSQLYLWRYIKDKLKRQKFSFKELIPHIKPELILFIPVIAISLYKIMDKIMLGLLSNMEQVGFYQNTEKLINIPLGLITALGTVMLPRMSNLLAKKEEKKVEKYIEKSMLFTSFLSNAFCFGLAGVSSIISIVFLGEKFMDCDKLILYLSFSIIFLAWANVIRTQYLIPKKMDKSYIISVFLGAFSNLIINFALIPRYHAFGAVIGTVIAEAVVCISQTFFVSKKLNIKKYIYDFIPFFLFGLMMFITLKIVDKYIAYNTLSLICMISIGALVYLSLSGIYMFLCKKDILLELLPKKNLKSHSAGEVNEK